MTDRPPPIRDDRHSLSFAVAATLATRTRKKPRTFRYAALDFGTLSGLWRPAHGPLGFPLFLRPPGASLESSKRKGPPKRALVRPPTDAAAGP